MALNRRILGRNDRTPTDHPAQVAAGAAMPEFSRNGTVMIKPLLVCVALASFLMGSSAHSQEVPPPSDQAKRVEDLVNQAAAVVEQRIATLDQAFR
jgi:hypothetical protein